MGKGMDVGGGKGTRVSCSTFNSCTVIKIHVKTVLFFYLLLKIIILFCLLVYSSFIVVLSIAFGTMHNYTQTHICTTILLFLHEHLRSMNLTNRKWCILH